MITLPKLEYAFDSLTPTIDAKTMEIHYTKHFQTYIDNTNAVLDLYPELQKHSIEQILTDIQSFTMSEKDRTKLRNNAGGVANHALYFSLMAPKKQPDQALVKRITTTFGSLEEFKKQAATLGTGLFGSGWVWLVEDNLHNMILYTLPNQDSPITLGHTPIIGLDVWEHAYYLGYQNRRAEYIDKWWSVLKIIP